MNTFSMKVTQVLMTGQNHKIAFIVAFIVLDEDGCLRAQICWYTYIV